LRGAFQKMQYSHWSKYFMLWNALFSVIAGHGDSLLVS
jgi:hypothetical protein